MISQRHPGVAEVVVHELEGPSTSLHLSSAAEAARQLSRVCQRGMSLSLAGGHPRATLRKWKRVPFWARWQHEAAARLEWHFRDQFMTRLTEPERALLRSQSGTVAGMIVAVSPSHPLVRLESQLFRVLLLRRLRLPLPPSSRTWPSSQLLWPSSCVVCAGGGFGQARICSGACGSSHLPRSWWTCRHQHLRA